MTKTCFETRSGVGCVWGRVLHRIWFRWGAGPGHLIEDGPHSAAEVGGLTQGRIRIPGVNILARPDEIASRPSEVYPKSVD